MHKFQVDSSIVNAFLDGHNMKEFKDNEIYLIGENNEINLFTMPQNVNYDRINLLLKRLTNVLKYFSLSNEAKYQMFLKDNTDFEQKIIIKLVVGMPPKFKKLFRSTSDGYNNIIIDLANYTASILDYDEMIEDIEDYLGYALTLLVLDGKETSNIQTSINTFEHAIYCTSYACYISESNQLNFMRNLNLLDLWIFLEYDALVKIVKERKHASRYALEYLDMALFANPEMITLGVTGKVFLEDKELGEAKKLFLAGPSKFVKKIMEDSDLRFVRKMMKSASAIKFLIIPLVVLWVITLMVSLYQVSLNLPFKILPLIIMFLATINETLKYKLATTKSISYFVKILIYFVLSSVFCFIVR
ncbi:MAG: hypothetical protein IJX78_06960 [Bacilli bacterium]|nr:hypothetical protein [Bacilli bacterium]